MYTVLAVHRCALLQRGRVISDKTAAVENRVSALREQLQTLQTGLLEAKEELDRSRKARERLTAAKEQVLSHTSCYAISYYIVLFSMILACQLQC
jgi:hypothetical protein